MADPQSPADLEAIVAGWIDAAGDALFSDPEGVCWVSADIMMLMRSARVHHSRADAFADAFLHAVLRRAGERATVLVSAFHFQFPQTGIFDVATSTVQTGAFGALLAARYPRRRLVHPFYSMLAFGARADAFLAHRFEHSTGAGSVFEWLIDNRTTLVTIGHHYVKALTSVHHAEEVVGVAYRYRKAFTGTVVDADGNRADGTWTFFVRDLEACEHSAITRAGDAVLRAEGLLTVATFGDPARPLGLYRLDLGAANERFVADLKSPEPRMIGYFGQHHADPEVITWEMANRDYIEELKRLRDI